MSRLRVMALSGVVATASQAVTALVFLTGTARVWALMVLAALQGTARAFGNPAMGALIPDTISPGRLQQATALLSISSSAIDIGGAAVGGLLVAAIGPGSTILLNSATSLAEVAIRFLMRVDEPAHGVRERRAFRHDLGEGWRAVASRRWFVGDAGLRRRIRAGGGWAMGRARPGPCKELAGGPKAWGFIESGYGLGALAGARSCCDCTLHGRCSRRPT
jgi:MFS family permease